MEYFFDVVSAEGDVEFFVLNVLDFDSTRKRMSIIVQHPLSKEIILFVKGADSAILSVLHKRYKGEVQVGCIPEKVFIFPAVLQFIFSNKTLCGFLFLE